MNWDAVGSIAEILAALAVIVSVLYLARQIRDAASSNEARTYFDATESLNQHLMQIAQDAEMTRIYNLGSKDFGALSEEECHRFGIMVGGIFSRHNNFLRQHEKGVLPEEWWELSRIHLGQLLEHPGICTWSEHGLITFPKEIRELVEDIRSEKGT